MQLATRILIGIVAALMIGGFAVIQVAEYKGNSNETSSNDEKIATASRNRVQDRVDVLARDGCQSKAIELFKLHSKLPFASASDMPPALHDDLQLCIERGILSAYIRDDLRDKGLMDLFVTPG